MKLSQQVAFPLRRRELGVKFLDARFGLGEELAVLVRGHWGGN